MDKDCRSLGTLRREGDRRTPPIGGQPTVGLAGVAAHTPVESGNVAKCGCFYVGAVQLCRLHAAAPEMYDVMRLPILFHQGGEWTKEHQAEWLWITGTTEATSRVMCDTIRALRAKIDGA